MKQLDEFRDRRETQKKKQTEMNKGDKSFSKRVKAK